MESIFSTQNLHTFLRRKNLRPPGPDPPGPPGPRPPGPRPPAGRSGRSPAGRSGRSPDGRSPAGRSVAAPSGARGVAVAVLVSSAMVSFFFLPARLSYSVGGTGPAISFFLRKQDRLR